MNIPSTTDPAQYRVTFFFGPEPVDDRPDVLRCVFNVKKRSWKGGVQVGIDIAHDYLEQARRDIGFSTWMRDQLQGCDAEQQEEVSGRADELFIQSVCTCALNLALRAGIEQANQVIAAAAFASDLRDIIREQPKLVTEPIRLELDLGEITDI